MSYKIFSTLRFERELKRLAKKFPSLKAEFALLVDTLRNNPTSGTSLGNHCYKIRLAIVSKGKGKSGGARVITYVYVQMETVYLLTMYDKGERSDLKPNELKEIVQHLDLS